MRGNSRTASRDHGFNISNPVLGPANDLEKPEIKLETKGRSQAKERQPDEKKRTARKSVVLDWNCEDIRLKALLCQEFHHICF
jgi:hypothetical protein